MSRRKNRKIVRVNHRTGNKVTTAIRHYGNVTHITRTLKKSDGICGTRFLGTEKRLTDKSIRRG